MEISEKDRVQMILDREKDRLTVSLDKIIKVEFEEHIIQRYKGLGMSLNFSDVLSSIMAMMLEMSEEDKKTDTTELAAFLGKCMQMAEKYKWRKHGEAIDKIGLVWPLFQTKEEEEERKGK